MKIFAIVVYWSPENSFSAHHDKNLFGIDMKIDPFEKLIKDKLAEHDGEYANFVREFPGYHDISMPNGAVYTYCDGEKIMVVMMDEAIKKSEKHKLFDKVDVATKAADLQIIIDNPGLAVKDQIDLKIDKLKNNLGEVVQFSNDAIEKLIERGEKIAPLVEKTEALKTQTILFRKQATHLKESMQCPGIWSIFTPVTKVASLIFGKKEPEFEYEQKDSGATIKL